MKGKAALVLPGWKNSVANRSSTELDSTASRMSWTENKLQGSRRPGTSGLDRLGQSIRFGSPILQWPSRFPGNVSSERRHQHTSLKRWGNIDIEAKITNIPLWAPALWFASTRQDKSRHHWIPVIGMLTTRCGSSFPSNPTLPVLIL